MVEREAPMLTVYHEPCRLATVASGGTVLLLRPSDTPREEARRLLALGAAALWGWDRLPEMARTPAGKPYFPAHPQCRFSLSHSRRYALCALSGEEVGCDVEELRPRRPDLPRRALSAGELERFHRLGGDWPAFYRLWTEKEAMAKFLGVGLRGDPRRVPRPQEGFLYHMTCPGGAIALCSIRPLTVFAQI